MDVEMLKKMAETIFHGSDTKLTIYTTMKQGKKINIGMRKERDTLCLIIENKDKSYKEILNTIKDMVKDKAAAKKH